MKILFCTHSLNPATGGPRETLLNLPAVLQSWGHKPEILTLDEPGEPWLTDYPVPVSTLGPTVSSYGYTKRLIPWLIRNVHRFDAVTVHGLWQYHGFAVRQVLLPTSIPYFLYPHGMLNLWAKSYYPLKHLKKWIYWNLAEYRILRDARAVLFTCEEERRLAGQVFGRYRCNEVVVYYGTIDPGGDKEGQKESFLHRFSHLKNKTIILYLGRLHEKKGIDLLLRAFARFSKSTDCDAMKNLHLVIAGASEYDYYLKSLKDLQSLEFGENLEETPVTWTGMLEGDLKWGAFRAADAFILPSHQENFGIAVAEALSTGTPVLLSDKVNIRCEIEEEGAGFIEDDTLDGCYNLLQRYQAAQGNEWDQMRLNARNCFINRFEVKKAAESLLQVIEKRQG